jgi:hypothetical protein
MAQTVAGPSIRLEATTLSATRDAFCHQGVQSWRRMRRKSANNESPPFTYKWPSIVLVLASVRKILFSTTKMSSAES